MLLERCVLSNWLVMASSFGDRLDSCVSSLHAVRMISHRYVQIEYELVARVEILFDGNKKNKKTEKRTVLIMNILFIRVQ